jgi:hypothetical protein
VRKVLINEAAYFTAWNRDDAVRAQRWAKQIKRPEHLSRLNRLQFDVALHCAKRDFDRMLELWHEAIEFIEKIPGELERSKHEGPWKEWRQELEERHAKAIRTQV